MKTWNVGQNKSERGIVLSDLCSRRFKPDIAHECHLTCQLRLMAVWSGGLQMIQTVIWNQWVSP